MRSWCFVLINLYNKNLRLLDLEGWLEWSIWLNIWSITPYILPIAYAINIHMICHSYMTKFHNTLLIQFFNFLQFIPFSTKTCLFGRPKYVAWVLIFLLKKINIIMLKKFIFNQVNIKFHLMWLIRSDGLWRAWRIDGHREKDVKQSVKNLT